MIPDENAALPHYGLSNADILYECSVEGNMTRLMAVFKDWKSLFTMPSSGGTSSSTVSVSVSDSVSAGAAVLSCTSATGTVCRISCVWISVSRIRRFIRKRGTKMKKLAVFLLTGEIHTQDIRLPAQKSVKRLCVTQL